VRWARGHALLVALAVCAGPRAFADPTTAAPTGAVALLPLDADARLELYGQPVASEIARVLIGGGVDVVVVGPRMAVPEHARLIVDGTIAAGKGDAVVLAVRIRDRMTGTVLDKLDASAPTLTNIDRAAADLAARVLPAVKSQLATLDRAPRVPPHVDSPPASLSASVATPVTPGVTLAIGPGVMHEALQAAFGTVAERHHFAITTAEHVASVTVLPLAYSVETGPVPLARARAHIKIETGGHVVFDRVIVTDTVVGDRNLAADQLVARTARAIIEIAEPHFRHTITGWK
jgi:hypothetical protein